MIDITDELRALTAVLDTHEVDYALCGGMAMAVHGFARTTIDIDLLILSDALDDVLTIAKSLNYNIRGKDMSFANGAVEMRRVSKIDPDDGELLSLDLLLVTPDIIESWESRLEAEWEGRKLSVVSAKGLIALKQLRGSDQDLVDIKALRGEGSNEAG
ncbi:MAG: nucleotidyl transferase AbiEii/AbiGii toxin family protein [bacterium]